MSMSNPVTSVLDALASNSGIDPAFAELIAPRATINRDLSINIAKAETTISMFARQVRGSESDERGYRVIFRQRDHAVCAKALLEHHDILKDVSILGKAGGWSVSGAWVRS